MEQRTPEWFAARRGIPTASGFKQIITSRGEKSTSANTYMNKLLAEWMVGESEDYQNEWMVRGTELEPEARKWFEFVTDLEVKEEGFITCLDGMCGCSPDGLVGDDSGLEIKCPAPQTHIKYLLDGKLPSDYVPQVQGSMYITGRKSWHFVSYLPNAKNLHIEVARDDEWCEKFDAIIRKFLADLLDKRAKLEAL